jgi:hypothetical protein
MTVTLWWCAVVDRIVGGDCWRIVGYDAPASNGLCGAHAGFVGSQMRRMRIVSSSQGLRPGLKCVVPAGLARYRNGCAKHGDDASCVGGVMCVACASCVPRAYALGLNVSSLWDLRDAETGAPCMRARVTEMCRPCGTCAVPKRVRKTVAHHRATTHSNSTHLTDAGDSVGIFSHDLVPHFPPPTLPISPFR